MDYSWIPRALVPTAVVLVFTVFRKMAPSQRNPELERYDRHNGERLPTGLFGLATVLGGLAIAFGGFFLLRFINHHFPSRPEPVLMRVFPPTVIWAFLPGFAALALPWPIAIYILRHSKYRDEAAYIEAQASASSGFDCYKVMRGMVIFLVVPIAFFTILALPEQLVLTDHDVRWTHYASIHPEVFEYSQARQATLVEGYLLRDGSFQRQFDFILDFADGRRLSANAIGDGGSEPSVQEVEILLQKTGLTPREVRTLKGAF